MRPSICYASIVFTSIAESSDLSQCSGFTTIPVGIFKDLPALQKLMVGGVEIRTLDVGVFDDVAGSLRELYVQFCPGLTWLPADLFRGLSGLTYLKIQNVPKLRSIPVGLFQDTTEVTELDLSGNGLTALQLGTFHGLTKVVTLALQYNSLTTLPASIFEPLTSLQNMWLHGDGMFNMQCLPDRSTVGKKFENLLCSGVLSMPLLSSLRCVAGASAAISTACSSTGDPNDRLLTTECTPAKAVFCLKQTTCRPGTRGYTCEARTAPGPTPHRKPKPGGETCGVFTDIEGIVGKTAKGTACCPAQLLRASSK
ncbi:unnamed protein product, partial [Ectocarpus sp. 4 AP-2014]